MTKEIEQLTNEDLEVIWPAIGGTPHLFAFAADDLKQILTTGEIPDECGLQLDYYTMAAIVSILQERGFVTPKFNKDGEIINSNP